MTLTAFLVPKGNPQGVKNFADVKAKGRTVAVLNGTIEQEVAEATGIVGDKIQPYAGQPELFQALRDDRAYRGALTDISLRELLEQNAGAAFEVTDGFVFGEGDLVDASNAELDKLPENGEWLKIVEPFGFTEDNLPPDDVTIERPRRET